MYKGERNDLLTDSITRTLTQYSEKGIRVLHRSKISAGRSLC